MPFLLNTMGQYSGQLDSLGHDFVPACTHIILLRLGIEGSTASVQLSTTSAISRNTLQAIHKEQLRGREKTATIVNFPLKRRRLP